MLNGILCYGDRQTGGCAGTALQTAIDPFHIPMTKFEIEASDDVPS